MRSVPGLRVIAEYPGRFDADLALALLADAGIEAKVLGDAASENAGYGDVQGYLVAVRPEVADEATDVLRASRETAEAADDEPPRGFRDRPAWVRYGTYATLGAIAGPIIIAALIEAEWLIDALFP